jgi:AGZA family xanthine/uracil permease-like MFS transporter
MKRYRWAAVGDVNAFFGLMLDNVVNLVILAGILVHVFGFPEELVYGRMFPGTALGVLFGDVVYTWLAIRLAAKTGRDDVTAMPLGLDAPSTIGMAFAVLGPAFLAAKGRGLDELTAAEHAWHVGMGVMVLIGIFKLVLSFFGGMLQRLIPSAGLLGTLGGIGIALLGTLQLGELLHEPIVGFAALGVIWYSLVSKIRLPGGAPEVLASAALGTALFYGLYALGLTHTPVDLSAVAWHAGIPWPTLGFVDGLEEAVTTYLPVAVPFAVLTVVGGINVTESARIGGDDYDTREILLTEALATLIAGVCGGVSQSTPYIGQPAYKAMGGKAAYTLATGLFVGLGGVLGYIPALAQVLPKAALVPILLFVAADIVEQSFHEVPRRHGMAVTFAMMPNVAQFALILLSQANGALLGAPADPVGVAAKTGLSPEFVGTAGVFVMLAHGFILTGMLWGGALAYLADRRAGAAVATLLVASVFTLFGVIHSTDPDGGVYLPWNAPGDIGWQWAAGYAVIALTVAVLSRTREFREATPLEEGHH